MTLERVDEQYRGLTYPWGRLEHPGDEPFEVAPGVWWARFAMPGPLNHINLWLLEDGDGWTIVDTCLNLDSAKERWESLFTGFMADKPVHRVICTHMHPDHIGLAGWLCERFDCDLYMTQAEFLTGSLIMGLHRRSRSATGHLLLSPHGVHRRTAGKLQGALWQLRTVRHAAAPQLPAPQ